MKTAIGYVRISKKDQSVYSLDAQESLIREYCQRNNVSMSAIFRDDGECSDTFDRPDYIALENFIKARKGRVNFLVIKDHDRFSRNLSEALAKIEYLERKHGVKVVAIDEPINIDTTDPGIFLGRAFKYLMANHELLNIRKRTTQGLRNAMAAGRVVNNAPFGYNNIRDSEGRPTLQINELKAPVVRFIFQQFINGVSPSLISKEARKIGYTMSGNSAIMRVLTNPLYAGLLRLPAYNGEPEKFVKALHEPIITEVDFWVANDKINNRPRYRTRPREDFPLRGIVKCDCGWHLTASYSKGKNKYYMYYSCPKERNRNYRGERMHELIEKVLMSLSFTPLQIETICKHDVENLEQEAKDLGLLKQSQHRQSQHRNGHLQKMVRQLSAEKGALETAIGNLAKSHANLLEKLQQAMLVLTNLRTLYLKISLASKQALLKKVFEGCLVYDGHTLDQVKSCGICWLVIISQSK